MARFLDCRRYIKLASNSLFVVAVVSILLTSCGRRSLPEGLPEMQESESEFNEPKKESIDENLLLVRVLESLYWRWPYDYSDSSAFKAKSADLLGDAIRYRDYIRTENLDALLGERFDDFISVLSAYTSFVEGFEETKRTITEEMQQGEASSVERGIQNGLANPVNPNASAEEQIGKIIVVAITTYFEENKRAKERKDSVDQELQRRLDEHDALRQQSMSRAQDTARSLETKYGWERGEIGWDLSLERATLRSILDATEDYIHLIEYYEEECELRPKDPVPRLLAEGIRYEQIEQSAEELESSALRCEAAASLIPAKSVYAELRQELLQLAAQIALSARVSEFNAGLEVKGSTARGDMAVELWKRVLEIDSTDRGGELRESLALSCLINGRIKEAEAVAATILEMKREDAGFCYTYACIKSRAEQPEQALEWLRTCIRLGYPVGAWAWADPDLDYLREHRNEVFSELVSPQWSWYATDDWLWDDVVLTNESSFALTSLILTLELRKGESSTSLQLECEFLGAGQSKTWEDVVKGASGTWDETSTASIACDQLRK